MLETSPSPLDLPQTPLKFVHLRCHSEYSIVDGIVRIDDYVKQAIGDQMPALALTDLSNLFGAIKFYKAARSHGLKPIIGCDIWLENSANREQPSRLLLLCQSHAGYLLLCQLLSRAYLSNQYRGRAEFKREWFVEGGTDGLLLLSGAMAGDVGQACLQGNQDLALKLAAEWQDLFPDRFYLEVQRIAAIGQNANNEEDYIHHARSIASQLGLPIVATHPIQFITPDDFRAHEARTCISEGYVLADTRRPKNFTTEQYFKTQSQIATLFVDMPEALANSVEIAKRCNLSLTLGKNYLPNFPTPNNEGLNDYLIAEARRGLAKRLAVLYPDENVRTNKQAQYDARLDFETNVINQMGFAGYFLIVADFINWAKNNGVPVGPGRGSGAGSVVAYSLGITDLDPLEYNLLFERFLNPDRVSMPDFDIDFCQEGRDRVIDYVKQKYGLDAVSQIATFGTMAAKAVIRDVGRVLDLPFHFVDGISKLIPLELGITLSDALVKEPQLAERRENEEELRELLELALRLEGLVRNVGMHAGGVLISPGKISDFSPVYCQADGASLVSQYDKDDVEAVGLVKFDFLGLRTLTILELALNNANKQRAAESLLPLSFETFPLNDKATFQLLKTANTTAVFQLESKGMKDMLKQAMPDCFEDIIALVALYRPGPMDLIPDFCRRKHGKQRVEYPHPLTEPILKETYGIAVYQEQVMQIAQVVAGYSLGGADLLRRAMGKKKQEEMDAQRKTFTEGAVKNNMTERQATELFDLLEKFAGYGFNKSHAAAYALVAYQTAYLKAHYPAAFLASTMSADMNNTDSVHIFYDDCAPNQIEVLPPDVNQSEFKFTPINKNQMLYGLGAVKGTGQAAIEIILQARRQDGPFTSLFDFCSRLDLRKVNRRVIESLIRAGAFDKLEPNRYALLAGVSLAISAAEQASANSNQNSLFGEASDHAVHVLPSVTAWPEQQRLQEEKSALGFYFSGHPYWSYQKDLSNFISTTLANLTPKEQPQLLAGIVSGVRIRMTARGKMAIVGLDDGTTRIEVVVGNELLNQNQQLLKDDQLVIVEGRVSNDEFSGGVRVNARKLHDLSSLRNSRASFLKISCNGQADAVKLKSLLKPYCISASQEQRGCAVKVEYHNKTSKVELMLGNDWRVDLHEELIASLTEWLSQNNVKILYN
ncbi:MAG: DNA polymerase III subunit alpha [Methylotenera sp.]|nr:DNA polymerase III subunit alpha [Methylotenera sp.]MDP2102489.1 DNA polymerase III subunit alpha [Methylotenera sp.]MDP2280194.1 DNA polymerase III subunit alpha [Methylotenera sp.]MDP2402600.1 DNA polymerase III subunit alpha [Methylotenera sp.]MDP3059178.1 DNA polymerase III subunit alpha [Methylotenera sp.]